MKKRYVVIKKSKGGVNSYNILNVLDSALKNKLTHDCEGSDIVIAIDLENKSRIDCYVRKSEFNEKVLSTTDFFSSVLDVCRNEYKMLGEVKFIDIRA